jgi:hypothetical protein
VASKHGTFKICAENLVKLHNRGWPGEGVVNRRGVIGLRWAKK